LKVAEVGCRFGSEGDSAQSEVPDDKNTTNKMRFNIAIVGQQEMFGLSI